MRVRRDMAWVCGLHRPDGGGLVVRQTDIAANRSEKADMRRAGKGLFPQPANVEFRAPADFGKPGKHLSSHAKPEFARRPGRA